MYPALRRSVGKWERTPTTSQPGTARSVCGESVEPAQEDCLPDTDFDLAVHWVFMDPLRRSIDVVTAESGCRYRSSLLLATASVTCVALLGTLGCGRPQETGYADQSRTQIQFYSPPGATVTVRACPTRSHQIGEYGPFEHRLEMAPEEFAVFNLKPGRYEFKYVSAEGLPAVSVYGELEVKRPCSNTARMFQRRAFVPIGLPSAYYQRAAVQGDEIFPWRGEALRTAIDELDLTRLKQGDVVEKIFVVADLEDAEEELREAKVKLAVAERELQYTEARFKEAYYDFRLEVSDAGANFWGTDREFIKWEAKRQLCEQRLQAIEAKITRLAALLAADRVWVREGMMVVATEQIVEGHEDPVDASGDIGEVLLVMRIGGRHMHWGDPRKELAAYEQ